MSETILASPPATSTNTASGTAPAASSSDEPEELGYNEFLTLLVAQVRNQDPLEPLDSTQYISQLAEFSALEQQLQTNDTLETINGTLAGGGLEDAVAWIGKDVAVEGAASAFSGAPLDYRVSPEAGADAAEVRIRNEAGGVVARFEIEPGAAEFAWNGLTDDGASAPVGGYTAAVYYSVGEASLGAVDAAGFASVEEVRADAAGVRIHLSNGRDVGIEDIEAVRESGSV
ncbi:MAG: flagellar hook capping FlgD N-terminal domain-containing protein [Pseudomonadota bacterium]